MRRTTRGPPRTPDRQLDKLAVQQQQLDALNAAAATSWETAIDLPEPGSLRNQQVVFEEGDGDGLAVLDAAGRGRMSQIDTRCIGERPWWRGQR